MVIDASALTATLIDEDDARELLARLQLTPTRLTSPLAVWEAAVAVEVGGRRLPAPSRLSPNRAWNGIFLSIEAPAHPSKTGRHGATR